MRVKVLIDAVESQPDPFALYYEGDPTAGATVLEFLRLSKDDQWMVFGTDHFSGYALASGSRTSSRTKAYAEDF